VDWVGPSGSAQVGKEFCFFPESIFQCKINSGKPQKMFKGTENTQKIPKIPGKFLEIG
jgi:hypothetical protein